MDYLAKIEAMLNQCSDEQVRRLCYFIAACLGKKEVTA